MQIITNSGTVPTTSILPLFSDIFPTLVPPNKIKLIDGFNTGAGGALTGRVVPYSTIGEKTWQDLTLSGSTMLVSPTTDGGIVTPTVTLASRVYTLDLGNTDCDVYANFKSVNATTGTFGVLFRVQDKDNYLSLQISPTTYGLQSRIAAVAANLATAVTHVRAVRDYQIRVLAVGSSIKIYIDGALIFSTTSTLFSTQTKAGLFFTASLENYAKEIVMGY